MAPRDKPVSFKRIAESMHSVFVQIFVIDNFA
jgi:hypothetical protein